MEGLNKNEEFDRKWEVGPEMVGGERWIPKEMGDEKQIQEEDTLQHF